MHSKKLMYQQQLLDNTAGTNGSARKRKQVIIQGKPPPTNAGRLIQPNNLKVELIAFIQAENVDVIAVNKTLLGTTQNMHLPAEVTIHGCKVFMWTN